LNKDPRVITP
jgi:hypothetical protein